MADKLGLTRIKDGDEWKPLKGMWIKTESGWQEVKGGWTKLPDGTWERIYPTPAGVATLNSTEFTFRPYEHYNSNPQRLVITNTGDYQLTIQDVLISNGSSYTTSIDFTGLDGGTPQVLDPTETAYIDISTFGSVVGESIGNITLVNDVGYLGYSNVIIPITANVQPDYSDISVITGTTLTYLQQDIPAYGTIAIRNSGNGGDLNIDSIVGSTNLTISDVPTTIGFDFDTFTGNSASFTVTAANLSAGVYNETITITSNARNRPVAVIPVTLSVLAPHGSISWTTAGTYTWTVPAGVWNINLAAIGGGGGGGGSTEVGDGAGGGGGGSGGVGIQTGLGVWPGEDLTIVVGAGGTGSPFVGRDPGYQGGGGTAQSGQSTTITGNIDGTIQTITVTGGSGGASGVAVSSGGGGKIICTKLYELGMLPKEIYEADQAFGAQLVKERPDIYNGYRAWAEIVVDWMSGEGPQMMLWIRDLEERRQAQIAWSTRWAKEIATPWAEWMFDGKNKTGLALMAIGAPISKAVGLWQRWFGPSKKPAGFIKGLALIKIFVLLRAVVAIGKLLGK